LDYREILEYHHEKDADLTVAFVKVPRTSAARRFGMARLDEEDGERGGRVLEYEEKPADPKGEWASMTIYCFRPRTLYQALEANAAEDSSHEFGQDIIPRALAEGRRVYGFKFNGYWGYTRTINEYWQTSMDLLGRDSKVSLKGWGLRTNLEHRRIRDCPPVKIGAGAVIKNSLIYNGSIIEGRVENSIVFPRVHVAKGSSVRDSILFFNNTLAEGCHFNRVISDVDTAFADGCLVGGAGGAITVVGSKNCLAKGTVIEPGATLYPELDPATMPRTIKAGTVWR
jgi:glucose-1-phosphate adenylyltransferase